MKRPLWSSSSQGVLSVLVLAGLGAAGCKSTDACNAGTVLVTVMFDAATSAADSIDVQDSVNGGAMKVSTLAHNPGSTSGSVEIDFPGGYPQWAPLTVTIVAKQAGTVLGTATGSVAMLPSGCGTLTVTFGATGSDGGAGAGGKGGQGAGGQGGHAGGGGQGGQGGHAGGGGSGGAGGAGESDGGTPLCTSGTTRSCAADGYLGNCAKGTETCAAGKWSACSILPMAADSCSIKGDDANCNGTANDGCPCVSGDTQSCGPAAVGICKPGTSTCTSGTWGACVGAVTAAPRDCTSTADNNCDGVPDNTIDGVCQCDSGQTQACGTHPGLDGHGPCTAGSQSCVIAANKATSSWGTCTGSVGPAATDTCVQGNDADCNGVPNDGCKCVNNVTTRACGYCNNGTQTCVDGTAGTYTACAGATGQAFTPLTLQNTWASYGYGTAAPEAALDCNGVVELKGAMATSGAEDTIAFTLPAGLVPSGLLYLPVDGYAAAKVRLYIDTTGAAYTYAPSGTANDTTGFTSLEGVSFSVSSTGYTALTLQNGWTAYSGTRTPAASIVGGVVRLQGAIASGTVGATAFTLPASMAPPATLYLSADLYQGQRGRLIIDSGGNVSVDYQNAPTDAQYFTSLEGVWFTLPSTASTALTYQNGWGPTVYNTRQAAVSVSNGIVYFQGAISTSGTTLAPFVLPAAFWPTSYIYTPVDMCGSTVGRLNIDTSGNVSIQAEGNVTTNATCFTSLEGVSFAQ